jgi:hypothetical protein
MRELKALPTRRQCPVQPLCEHACGRSAAAQRGQVPQLVAWDAGFYAHLQEEGVWVFGKRP